jgi:hypothetical protein
MPDKAPDRKCPAKDAEPEAPKAPTEPPPGTLGTPPRDDETNTGARRPLRPMKRDGQRWRTNMKRSPKDASLDREFRRRAG